MSYLLFYLNFLYFLIMYFKSSDLLHETIVTTNFRMSYQPTFLCPLIFYQLILQLSPLVITFNMYGYVCMIQGLNLQFSLAWNSLCRPRWPWTCSNFSASVSCVLELRHWVTILIILSVYHNAFLFVSMSLVEERTALSL